MYIDSESELRKIGSQAKKFVLKDFAGKFGALFFIGFGYKIDAPILISIARGGFQVICQRRLTS